MATSGPASTMMRSAFTFAEAFHVKWIGAQVGGPLDTAYESESTGSGGERFTVLPVYGSVGAIEGKRFRENLGPRLAELVGKVRQDAALSVGERR